MPLIKGYIPSTLLDWEGRIAAIIFLPGCNLRCGYCHARHLLEALSDESIPLKAVLEGLQAQRGWIDGVVVSGGEPTLHADLPELIRTFRAEGFPVKLDTNGTRPDVLADLIEEGLVDHVAMDIKAPLDHRYLDVTGAEVDLDAIRASIDLLIGGGVSYEFRTTVCPAYLDEDGIKGVGMAVRGARTLYLQNFRPVNCLDRNLLGVKPYNQDEMRSLCRAASRYVHRCLVRGDGASERSEAAAAHEA
jgi:pyruvate formate lyase activating enzyme